jgi:hypothetical protein
MFSEFKENPKYNEVFEKHKLYMGRIISGSKSYYQEEYPNNVVIFNANIITKKSGKVWYGDIDATLDFDKLKDIADELKEDLYILREMDARFENEDAGFKFWKEHTKVIIKHS